MGEKVRVLIVDDSAFFRKRIREQLEQDVAIEIAGEAGNGREAVRLSAQLNPDLITMDVAMPEMDGIAAVREIMRTRPTDILMVSALTRDGARATLDALEAGAVDFLAKQGSIGGASPDDPYPLSRRIVDIATRRRTRRESRVALDAPADNGTRAASPGRQPAPSAGDVVPPRLVAIGASTGGPVAIQQVLAALPADYAVPVVVAVHMPAEFTATFAERLDAACRIRVRLAVDGEPLRAGCALIAPGGQQTLIERRAGGLVVTVKPGGEQLYKPSVDVLFGSAARALDGAAHAVILTGMGADGTDGARLLKSRGAVVWSQDQATSVVYGMPYSVVKAGCSDRVLPLPEIGSALAGLV